MSSKKTSRKGHEPLTPAVFHILFALSDGPLHGYAIMKSVDETAGLHMGPGTIYGSIQRMEEAGLVQEMNAGSTGRRRFRLTPLGKEALKAESARLTRLAELVRAKGFLEREVV
jgi:DNA-binding PadR family transcriptional regulator